MCNVGQKVKKKKTIHKVSVQFISVATEPPGKPPLICDNLLLCGAQNACDFLY